MTVCISPFIQNLDEKQGDVKLLRGGFLALFYVRHGEQRESYLIATMQKKMLVVHDDSGERRGQEHLVYMELVTLVYVKVKTDLFSTAFTT